MATLVYLSLSGMVPAYLAADCQLHGLRRRSSSAAFCHIKDVRCETNIQQLERGVSPLQFRSCGTAFQLICDMLTLAFNDLSDYERVLRSLHIATNC